MDNLMSMKTSKFIKDLFTTSVTQIIILVIGVIFLRIMATALSEEYFGIFMIIRRIIAIGASLITLNLGVGLTRYVSYKKEKEKEFLYISLMSFFLLSFLTIITFFVFRSFLSKVFFKSSNFSTFVLLISLYLFSNSLFMITYAFFRGRQEMFRANKMNFLYYFFQIISSLFLWAILKNQSSQILSLYYFLFFLWGILLSAVYIKNHLDFKMFKNIKKRIKSTKDLFFYSVPRLLGNLFHTLIFGIPVFFASHKISLEAAAYVGIAVSVVRLLQIFAIPLNLLFLPKFAEFKKIHNSQEIKHKVSIVIDFIISALPLLAILSFGLARYIVILFFGNKYLLATQSVSIVILFSVFYVAFSLLRGILDGLFSFPYGNFVGLSGFLMTATSSFLFHKSIPALALSFGLGLLFMGISPLFILIKKGYVSFQANKLVISWAIISLSLFILVIIDKWIANLILNEYWKFGIMILNRIFLSSLLLAFYWKLKPLWFREFLQRIRP